ncbi:GNAT family N-acetyltransferase [Paenibacillus protaetiae]|uniref:N-acetyltransferase n=1 Tax=Paenibacillus protaetiae TaxID=2509456 RepID=A0A4P6EVL7_9BACL|nr:N-acetyltransferase [Paenibacillus protaetiae]QAY66696.1 N-acetyltransferase [Paenibacillus protaetiae]
MIRIRNAKLDDRSLFKLIRTELIPLSYTVTDSAEAIRELPKRFQSGVTYVASAGTMSPAFGFVHFEVMDHILFVDMLAVAPEYRSYGWGRRLMAACEAHGLSHGCKTARLFVDDINNKAQQFYARLGYARSHYYPDLHCYEMIKPLPR